METWQGGIPLPQVLRRFSERSVGIDLQNVRVAVSGRVETCGAAALAVGDRAFDRFVARTVSAVVAEAEERAGCSFVNHMEIEELVRCGLGVPLLLENPY